MKTTGFKHVAIYRKQQQQLLYYQRQLAAAAAAAATSWWNRISRGLKRIQCNIRGGSGQDESAQYFKILLIKVLLECKNCCWWWWYSWWWWCWCLLQCSAIKSSSSSKVRRKRQQQTRSWWARIYCRGFQKQSGSSLTKTFISGACRISGKLWKMWRSNILHDIASNVYHFMVLHGITRYKRVLLYGLLLILL